VHVDIKKLGRIPDGGGHRIHGRAARPHLKQARPGYAYLHNAVDDHSRLAYTEILTDERKETAAAFWQRALAYFTSCGITVARRPPHHPTGRVCGSNGVFGLTR